MVCLILPPGAKVRLFKISHILALNGATLVSIEEQILLDHIHFYIHVTSIQLSCLDEYSRWASLNSYSAFITSKQWQRLSLSPEEGKGGIRASPPAGRLQPQRGRGIHLLHSSCGVAHALEGHGLKGDQLHQTGLTNGRCCEFHYPLSQQRG